MPSQFDPPSGTRDFLAADVEQREHAFAVIRSVFGQYGFEPLQTPAFERLDVLLGKYGDEGDKLVFKILRRGEHEASGEADLALRYDMTVPLARVAAAYGSQLPTPYKRYAMGPVWRADRPGKDRYREFIQCDLDTLGSSSLLADAEVLSAHHDALAGLGLPEFTILLNSRRVLAGLMEAFSVPPDIRVGVLTSLDKLDKLAPADVVAELTDRGLAAEQAGDLVGALTAADSADQVRVELTKTEEGSAGLDEVDTMLTLLAGQIPAGRIRFTPRMVRGLSYYTGPIWEVTATGVAGSIGAWRPVRPPHRAARRPGCPRRGLIDRRRAHPARCFRTPVRPSPRRLDVAVTVMGPELAADSFGFAAAARSAGLRASVYLGSSGKLGRQLKWASDTGARWCLIYGENEHEAGVVTVRDMTTGEQVRVPAAELAGYLAAPARGGLIGRRGFMEPVAWHASLPGVIVAASALIRDPAGNVLVVKPNYRDHWTLPGGICEFGEAPHDGCAREVSEELGLDLAVGPLLSVDWQPALPDYGPGARPAIYFIFGCGTLADRGGIRLQAEELDDCRSSRPRPSWPACSPGSRCRGSEPRWPPAAAIVPGMYRGRAEGCRWRSRPGWRGGRVAAVSGGRAAQVVRCQAAAGRAVRWSARLGGRGELGKPVSLAHGGRAERGGQVGLQRREDIGH